MSEIYLAELTLIPTDEGWTGSRKFDYLPFDAPADVRPEDTGVPDTFDVLLITVGNSPAKIVAAVCEVTGASSATVLAVLADLPHFVARNVSPRPGHKLVMQMMELGGWAELHLHEDGNAPRPSGMDESMIESTRQMAAFFSQQMQMRGMSGLMPAGLGNADDMFDNIDALQEQGRALDEKRRAGLCDVFVRPSDEATSPTAEQERALMQFFSREQVVCANVLDAIWRYYQWYRRENPDWFDDENEVETLDELRSQVSFNGLIVRADSAAGLAVLGFAFHCDWEEEHGLGVAVHGETVLDVGDWETSDRGPHHGSSPWLTHCATKPERALAKRIAPELEAAQAAGIPTPHPAMEYLQALWSGDTSAVERMHAQGLDVNSLPPGVPAPLFMAIESLDAAQVRKLLTLGVRVDVLNHQQQTPLQLARELLANYQHVLPMQERELAGLEELSAAPEGTPPPAGTLLGGLQAFRELASQLLGQSGEPVRGLPGGGVVVHRARYTQLVAESRQAIANLTEIVQLLERQSRNSGGQD